MQDVRARRLHMKLLMPDQVTTFSGAELFSQRVPLKGSVRGRWVVGGVAVGGGGATGGGGPPRRRRRTLPPGTGGLPTGESLRAEG